MPARFGAPASRLCAPERPAAGIVSFWLLETAYHARPLAAAQPGITLADPLVATTWGVFVFGKPVRTGPVLVLLAVPAVALIAGALALIRSPRCRLCRRTEAAGETSRRDPGSDVTGQ